VQVIPVLDLARGRAVSGRGGRRETYAAVRSRLISTTGDARALVAAYRDALGCDECYVADLDALAGGAVQHLVPGVADGLAGVAGFQGRELVEMGPDLLADGVHQVIVGLETLPSFDALAAVIRAVGPARVIFSLDLRNGEPLSISERGGTPVDLARAAVAAGAAGLLVLDLARVGSGEGADIALLAALRRVHPDVELLAGGGVATVRQLEDLAEVGIDAALVGTALHDGSLSAADLSAVRHRDHSKDSR